MTEQLFRLLTVRQLVERIGGVCENTIRNEIKRGNIAATRIGHCLRIREDEAIRWQESRTQRRAS
ncbi:MAG: hypothetical protein JWO62_1111 [Acidimicrobiaceae bacterium]|nr:hypothetical protein [Acidimicrobiaceae bacterium]